MHKSSPVLVLPSNGPPDSVWDPFDALLTECYSNLNMSGLRLDRMILNRRYANEGLPFLGGMLSDMLHLLNEGYEVGVLPHVDRSGFRLQRNSCLPRLFYGFWRRLFSDEGDLLLLDSTNFALIETDRNLRQILSWCGKVDAEIDERKLLSQEQTFISTNLSVSPVDWSPPVESEEYDLLQTAAVVARDIVGDLMLDPVEGMHGPGAVFEGLNSIEKDTEGWRFIPLDLVDFWRDYPTNFDLPFVLAGTSRLMEDVAEVLLPIFLMCDEEYIEFRTKYAIVALNPLDKDGRLDFNKTEPVFIVNSAHRAVYVNKTFDKKRRIGSEMTVIQAAQQGIKDQLQGWLENYTKRLFGSAQICGMFFTDQSINQLLALCLSAERAGGTIDSSSASDLVGAWHIKGYLNGSHPELLLILLAARSKFSRLYKSQVKSTSTDDYARLKMFAGMGSAVTFPLESLHFFCVSVAAISRKFYHDDLKPVVDPKFAKQLVVSKARLKRAVKHVTVYGDDVIIADFDGTRGVKMFDEVKRCLELVGGRVNVKKSFGHGIFRESCGLDAVLGHIVTPIKLRSMLPTDMPTKPKDFSAYTSKIVSYSATANLLFEAGYHLVSNTMFDLIRSTYGHVPIVPYSKREESSGIVQWGEECCLRQSPDFKIRKVTKPTTIHYTSPLSPIDLDVEPYGRPYSLWPRERIDSNASSFATPERIGYVAIVPKSKTIRKSNVTSKEFLSMDRRRERLTKEEQFSMMPGVCQRFVPDIPGFTVERGEPSRAEKRYSSSLFEFSNKGNGGRSSKPTIRVRRRFVELTQGEASCDLVCCTCPSYTRTNS